MTEPIQISFDVDCPVGPAFEVWTERIASWWPRRRVEIEHRGWERLGAQAEPWRDRNYAAWGTLLPRYREALSA
jgi:hypothetical protein